MARLHAKYRKDQQGRRVLQSYYAEFYDARRRPRQKRISLLTRDKTAARLKLTEMEREYMAGLRDPWTDVARQEGVTVRKAVDRFLKDRAQRCEPSTVSAYRSALVPFCDTLAPGFPMAGVEQRHLTAFVEAGERAEATRRSYLRWLGIFFAWCRKIGLASVDPMPPIRMGKRSRMKSLPAFLTEEEFEMLIRVVEAEAVLNRLPHGNRPLVRALRFAVGTGLRRGELCALRWSAIDLASRMLIVRNTEDFQTKSGRERPVPLVGDALSVIEELAATRTSEDRDCFVFTGTKGGKLNGNYLGKRFRQYRRKARLPENINIHSLRHTFASWFVQRGGDLYRLKEILGHADMKTTLVYAHLQPDALRQEMELCFGEGYAAKRSEMERLRALLEEKEAECERLRKELKELRPEGSEVGEVLVP